MKERGRVFFFFFLDYLAIEPAWLEEICGERASEVVEWGEHDSVDDAVHRPPLDGEDAVVAHQMAQHGEEVQQELTQRLALQQLGPNALVVTLIQQLQDAQ